MGNTDNLMKRTTLRAVWNVLGNKAGNGWFSNTSSPHNAVSCTDVGRMKALHNYGSEG